MKLTSRCCPRLKRQRDRPAFHLKIEKTVRTNGATSVRSSNSSQESGQWNFAALKRPVVSAYFRHTPVRQFSPNRSVSQIPVSRFCKLTATKVLCGTTGERSV